MKKKLRNTSVKSLTKKADRLYSIWLRTSELRNGYLTCVTCGKIGVFEEFDCGHYISREVKRLRYDERNTAPQCQVCNRFKEGRKDEFALYLIEKYGKNILQELSKEKWMPFKFDWLYLQGVIIDLEEKLK